MNRTPRIRLSSRDINNLLANRPVETVFRGRRCPARGESYPVTLQEPTELRVVVADSKLRSRSSLHVWTLQVVVDISDPPLVLNAESAGGVITPLAETRSEDEPEAHGYSDTPSRRTLDAGDGVDHELVLASAETKAAAHRHASVRVDELAKRRARSLGVEVRDVLMQANAHRVDVGVQVETIQAALVQLKDALKAAA